MPRNSKALPDHVARRGPAQIASHAAVPEDEKLEALTLVLARHPDRQRAFEKLLADQQDRTSPEFHHWLTPSQIGERFGLSNDELNLLTGWLQSHGLHVDWVAPGRNFIGFSGAAGDISRTFQADLNYYDVDGELKMSVTTPPLIPAELAPKVRAVHGLYTIENRPMHWLRAEQSSSPELTFGIDQHFIGVADFDAIYDVIIQLPYLGNEVHIGIVGRSRINFADYYNFQGGGYFSYPIEIVPTRFGGVDPGPARTSPPPAGVSIADQVEATLDVERAGSVSLAKMLLVVTTANHGDIGADAQYLVQTEPIPAPIMSISFGECGVQSAGRAGVEYLGHPIRTVRR